MKVRRLNMANDPTTNAATDLFLRDVGGRVANARGNAGWTQERLARTLGIQPATLSRYEVAARPFPLAVLRGVSAALGVPLRELVPEIQPEPDVAGHEAIVDIWNCLDADRRRLLLRLARELGRR